MKISKALALMFCLLIPVQAHAKIIDNPALYANEAQPEIRAEAAVLAEVEHGKILFQKNMNKKMYPASLVKIMTALVALDYLEPDELVIAGNEINEIPYDASRTYHKLGETLTVENLIRALFVASGNETACVLAMEVARRVSGNLSISYNSAEKLFAGLMNEKAKSLGAGSSNFVNPHGYHNSRQTTTAYDMLLICAEALRNPLIAQCAAETSFEGNGAGGASASITQNYKWKSANALITKNGEYYYPYATGIRTGQTDESASCLAAAAEKDGKKLICIMLYTEDPDRWLDAVKLFDYGFDNFGLESIQKRGVYLGEVRVANTPLGENDIIPISSNDSYSEFLSKGQYENVQRHVSFDPAFIYEPAPGEDTGETLLLPPIQIGDVIGKVSYILNGTVIFTGDVIAGSSAVLRTFNTDAEYYFHKYTSLLFSMEALPYWIIAALVSLIVTYIVFMAKRRLKEKQKGYKFKK